MNDLLGLLVVLVVVVVVDLLVVVFAVVVVFATTVGDVVVARIEVGLMVTSAVKT